MSVKVHLLSSEGIYLLAGDDVVVSKSGKQTHGVGRFYSDLVQRVIPSVSFFTSQSEFTPDVFDVIICNADLSHFEQR